MALLRNPFLQPHKLSDDLESFFWVLMYEVARYRSHEDLKEDMKQVFDQHSLPDDQGIVRGGDGKLTCLHNLRLSTMTIENIVKTPCHRIIEDVRSLFCDFYRYQDLNPIHNLSRAEKKSQQDPQANAAREKLQTSDAFLAIFENYLGSNWGINDDGSLDPTKAPQDESGSRNRRKRKARSSGGGKCNIHVQRVGRMPPESKEVVCDGYSSQTSITSGHSSLFSRSLLPSSGITSSKSLGSKNVGPSAK